MIEYEADGTGKEIPIIHMGLGTVTVSGVDKDGVPGVCFECSCEVLPPGEASKSQRSEGEPIPPDAVAAIIRFHDIRGIVVLEEYLLEAKERLLGMPRPFRAVFGGITKQGEPQGVNLDENNA